ncbi:MAG: hypothetical protein Q4C82_10810, partial [Eubacteriales bacterium]|nr:hypothetical protein [Eubacteriales bacterium]
MVLEMKRALEDIKNGDRRGYRKLYDAVCEEVYCRSFLITQQQDQALELMEGFLTELFGMTEQADGAPDKEAWLWDQYYRRVRRQYQKLLAQQYKSSAPAETLAKIPAALPLLHRVMLVMAFRDDYSAADISAVLGLTADKIQAELQKLNQFLPSLVKGQPQNVSAYLDNWKALLMGAARQLLNEGSDSWVDSLYESAAAAAGIRTEEPGKAAGDFEYFVADADLSAIQPKKKPAPAPEPEEDEEDDEDSYEDDEEEYDDED